MIWMHGAGTPMGLTPRYNALDGVALSIAPIGEHEASLFPEEMMLVQGSVAARRRQFATGRFLARQALVELGEPPCAIPSRPNRAPLWPIGLCGSLSHCPDLAVAVLSRRYRSIGVDIEQSGRIAPRLFKILFTAAEQRAALTEPRVTGLFSAKEAVFKAVNVVAGLQIDFLDVEIQLDLIAERFSARYVGTQPENRIIDHLVGLVTAAENRVLTLAALPFDGLGSFVPGKIPPSNASRTIRQEIGDDAQSPSGQWSP